METGFFIADQCETVSGSKPFKRCQFPFTHNGHTYHGCPVDPDDPTKKWCSTKIYSNGTHVSGQGEWGHCSTTCPSHSDSKLSSVIFK